MINDYVPIAWYDGYLEKTIKNHLPKQEHTVRLKLLNPQEGYNLSRSEVIICADQPAKTELK